MAKKEIIKNGLVTVRVNEAPVVDAAHAVVNAVESVPSVALEGAEAAVEGVVEGAQALEGVVEEAVGIVAKVSRNNPYVLGGVAAAALAAGSVGGYFYAKRKIVAHYDAVMEREMENTRKHFEKTHKVGSFETPEAAADELLTDAASAVRSYQGEQMAPLGLPKKDVPTLHTTVDVDGETVTQYVYKDRETVKNSQHILGVEAFRWDYEQEASIRASYPEQPYVVSRDEFSENEGSFEQDTLTYYAGDDTLVDTRDQLIDNTEYTVGDDNLMRFGHGSDDPNVVYIRNEKTGTDFEVVRDERSYSEVVLGIKAPVIRHSDVRRQGRRGRSADE